MVDNEPYFLKKWKEVLGDEIKFIGFEKISDCEDAFIDKCTDVMNSECVIVDFEFGYTNAGKKDFASYLRVQHGYKNPILLCSIHDNFFDYDRLIKETFTKVIDKIPMTWQELSKVLDLLKDRKC